jgi:hypothetical protein
MPYGIRPVVGQTPPLPFWQKPRPFVISHDPPNPPIVLHAYPLVHGDMVEESRRGFESSVGNPMCRFRQATAIRKRACFDIA